MRRDDVLFAVRSCQEIVQSRHDLCALTHCRGDTFDRARADVADREHAWATCLEQATIAAGFSAGQHKSFTVKRYAGPGEPIRVRIRSDEEEQLADGAAPRRYIGEQMAGSVAGIRVEPGTALRITTGAPVPDGADAIVMVEVAAERDGMVVVQEVPKRGDGIRPVGQDIAAGDVVVVPAGTGHQKISGSDDFLVIGAYPPDGTYDLCRGDNPAERDKTLAMIPQVPLPESDPVLANGGPLPWIWRR